jgi:hypothetical protein
MLQRVEPKIGKPRRLLMPIDAEDAAFFSEFVEHD